MIKLLDEKLIELKKKKISELKKINNFTNTGKNLDLKALLNESKKLKYKNSIFFMAIYINKNKEEILQKTEEQILNNSIEDYRNTCKEIINQNETKKPFLEINNIDLILKEVQNKNNYMKKEIDFMLEEFTDLGKDDYIKNNLLNNLNYFASRNKILILLESIIYFIESFDKIKNIQKTEFFDELLNIKKEIDSNQFSIEKIKKGIDLLKNYKIELDTKMSSFFTLIRGKEESLIFIKKIKNYNFDIRNLGEFIYFSEDSELQINDIDNLISVYSFFEKVINDQRIKTDENLLQIFTEYFNNGGQIEIKLYNYLNIYVDIIQLFESCFENPEKIIINIMCLLKKSIIYIFKDKEIDLFLFRIEYKNKNGNTFIYDKYYLEKLRNKLLLIGNSNDNMSKNKINNEIFNTEELTKNYIKLIDDLNKLTNIINSIFQAGYPNLNDLEIELKDFEIYNKDENAENDLKKLIKKYKIKRSNFIDSLENKYNNFPNLRLFYGKQFIQLYEYLKNRDNVKDINIYNLINSVTLNQIKNIKIDYIYNDKYSPLENINEFLEKLFENNNINLSEIYNKNYIFKENNLNPGLYRKAKYGAISYLFDTILNIYLNITLNEPTINTLLICNKDTSIEQIRAFLYRVFLCENQTLFLICNIESLELPVLNFFNNRLKRLNNSQKGKMNSVLIILYEKNNLSLASFLEKLIPEKNVLNYLFSKKSEEEINIFKNVEIHSSKYAGYGKTTEIIQKVKKVVNGNYVYLSLGGNINLDDIIENLINLKIDLKKGKTTYLHLDLYETDNNDLMDEILFKLIILRYLDSKGKIYYLGNDINILIEIQNGFYDFRSRYKILNLIKHIDIEKLRPLKLEENVKFIGESNISIVAEVLSLYDKGKIGEKNINLEEKISKSVAECEKIINKYFSIENPNYYQKINFIKILSSLFTKFTNNKFLECQNYYDCNINTISKARINITKNFIKLSNNLLSNSYFDTLLKNQLEAKNFLENYFKDENLGEEMINNLENKLEKNSLFSFNLINESLVLFNKDGGSISIITNKDKNDEEYQLLKELWNIQNYDGNNKKELLEYKNMNHDEILEQIKILFSLDKLSYWENWDTKDIFEKFGNYIFTSDNFFKIIRILINIETKIPMILMGETGVGKTKLFEILKTLYRKRINYFKLQITSEITDKDIIKFIEEIKYEYIKNYEYDELALIIFEEINASNSSRLIKEIICNHTYLGKKIDKNFVFLGTCNPYCLNNNKMRKILNETEKLNNLKYKVNPLPFSLFNYIFNLDFLENEEEKEYIKNNIILILNKLKKEKIISETNKKDLTLLINEIVNSIIICHDFIREKYDKASISIRDIKRFRIFLSTSQKMFIIKMKMIQIKK